MSTEKEFVPYTESFELKELGFDEPCLAYYTEGEYAVDKDGNKTNFVLLSNKLRGELAGHGTVRNSLFKWLKDNSLFKWLKDNDRTSGELYVLSNSITTPTFSQAFRWFREKYGYLSYIDMDNYSFYRYTIYKGKGISKARFETYEEAELACLRKLIEIVKQKS